MFQKYSFKEGETNGKKEESSISYNKLWKLLIDRGMKKKRAAKG